MWGAIMVGISSGAVYKPYLNYPKTLINPTVSDCPHCKP